VTGPSSQPEVDANKMTTAAAEFDANAPVADAEFPSMEEAVMLSRGIRTSVPKSSTGSLADSLSSFDLCVLLRVPITPEVVVFLDCSDVFSNAWCYTVTMCILWHAAFFCLSVCVCFKPSSRLPLLLPDDGCLPVFRNSERHRFWPEW